MENQSMSLELIQEKKPIKLNCSDLDFSLFQTVVHFEAFRSSLDKITEDMRTLEAFYQRSGICIPFDVEFEVSREVSRIQHDDLWHDYAYRMVRMLSWREVEGQGWKLWFEEFIEAGFLQDDGSVRYRFDYPDSGKRVSISKPLVETKAVTRFEAKKVLGSFHERFAAMVQEAAESCREIPF